jgi:hypothetical protein
MAAKHNHEENQWRLSGGSSVTESNGIEEAYQRKWRNERRNKSIAKAKLKAVAAAKASAMRGGS